ncbi:MAG: hypothetical protein K2N24_02310, partial [Lachnospiraceae bacterium]|nr:hypothetical protein [Lachnospiraceae bacterium]
MSKEQATEAPKKVEKPKKVLLKNQIERYLRIPFFLLIPLVILNGVVYFSNIETGIFLSVSIILYALIVTVIYIHNKPNIMATLISFAFEQGQVQKELLKDLAVPYALIDLDGKLLWANPLFYGIVGSEKLVKKSVIQIFPEITKEIFPQESKKSEFQMRYQDDFSRVEMRRVVIHD